MLKSSQCSVTFPINGLTLTSDITFQPGITAVVGRNGTGKTFKTIELWRYLLFGKKALRGPAGDYKSLKAEGVAAIRGVDYEIKRSAKGESVRIVGEDEPLAVGADAVNKKVIELLGFGLEVFDICNASVQKQSNKLTQLTPAKRKELIDEVAGLAQNERVERECKEKAKLLKLEGLTIRENVAMSKEPVKPDGYQPSAELEPAVKKAREVAQRRAVLTQIIDTPISYPPEPRQKRADIESIDAHEQTRRSVEAERRALEALIESIPTTPYSKQEVLEAQAWVQYSTELSRRGLKPEISEEEADDAISLYDRITALKSISMQVECPNCHTEFTPARSLPDEPSQPRTYYHEQKRRLGQWATPLEEPKGEPIEHNELQAAHTALARAAERNEALAKLAALPVIRNREAELNEQRSINAEWDLFEARMTDAKVAKQRHDEAVAELADLPLVDSVALDAAFVAARIYEQDLARFEREKIDYAEKAEKVSRLLEESGDFSNGAAKLAEARREVKAHLAPSLSRIASALISEMTCGKLNLVQVDDDMNVSVDGQDAATLSGAGETAANLALRLALGRTLVGGVFPVFLGDEIDADADEERSEATFECLRNLRGQFDQVIIITHKPHVLAEHVIDMDE